ncbi:MAG: DUF3050 domain-containing protein [Nitrospinae bacterium]|nr:DUF3050 domain-containing protein [Nitrospinota bacterium]
MIESPAVQALLNNKFLKAVKENIAPDKSAITIHPIFGAVRTEAQMRVFMEHHVFAVYDFMCLLKELQSRLTCVSTPWVPKSEKLVRRFINHMVLEEETDEDGQGGYASHLEMYQAAMEECGADTEPIDDLLYALERGGDFESALDSSGAPEPSKEFNRTTWGIIMSGKIHCVAAAFTFGREDPIPNMFRSFLKGLGEHYRTGYPLLRYYLDRHIHLDEDFHNPMAQLLVARLCVDNREMWQEAEETARTAIAARKKLWDGTLAAIKAAG